LFKPILTNLEKRSEVIDGSKAKADELREKGQKKLDEYNRLLDSAKIKAIQTQEEIKQEGSAKASEIIESAKNKETGIINEIRQEIAVEAQKARENLKAQAEILSKNVVSKILGRTV
jgi:F0F1-type ATP synthase membrane subunit b/b'